MKKYSSITKVMIICVLLLSSLCINSVPEVSKANIKIRKEAIMRDYNFGKKMDMMAVGTGSVLCAILTYKLIKYFLAKSDPTKTKCLSSEQLTERLILLEERFEKYKDPKLLSKSWFKSIGKSILTSFVSSSLAGIGLKLFDNFYKRYHCFDSLTEFIDVRFYDLTVVDELLCNAKLYDHCVDNKSAELQAEKDKFVISLRNLVAKIEDIIAFMEFKIDSLEYVALAQEDILIPNYLYNSLEKYCANITAILEGDSQEILFDASENFRDDAIRLIESFKGLENRIAWLS